MDYLINALYANPDDDLVRLVLADYLAEIGEFEKESRIRNWIDCLKPQLREMWEKDQCYLYLESDTYFWMMVIGEIYRFIAEEIKLEPLNQPRLIQAELKYYGFDIEVEGPIINYPKCSIKWRVHLMINAVQDTRLNSLNKRNIIRGLFNPIIHIMADDPRNDCVRKKLSKIHEILWRFDSSEPGFINNQALFDEIHLIRDRETWT